MDSFDRITDRTPPETRRLVAKALDITDRIHALMQAQSLSQKALAQRLGKSESEVSRYLSGLHNLELRTIARLETALSADILMVPPTPLTR